MRGRGVVRGGEMKGGEEMKWVRDVSRKLGAMVKSEREK